MNKFYSFTINFEKSSLKVITVNTFKAIQVRSPSKLFAKFVKFDKKFNLMNSILTSLAANYHQLMSFKLNCPH